MHCQSVSHEDLDEIRRESCQDKEKEERGKYDPRFRQAPVGGAAR